MKNPFYSFFYFSYNLEAIIFEAIIVKGIY